MRRTGYLLIAMLATPIAIDAQSNRHLAPTDVVREFFKAQADGRWRDAASFLNLEAFEPYREDAIRQTRMMKGRGGPTVEQVMAREPDMPRAVAEYVAKKYAAMADSDALSHEFAHTVSPDTLAALTPEQAAARWLEARDVRWQLERSAAHLGPECQKPSGLPFPDRPTPKEVLSPAVSATQAAGSGDSVSYVLYRDKGSNSAGRISQSMPPGIVTLKRVGGEWKILPLPDLGFPGGNRTYASVACTRVSGQSPTK